MIISQMQKLFNGFAGECTNQYLSIINLKKKKIFKYVNMNKFYCFKKKKIKYMNMYKFYCF